MNGAVSEWLGERIVHEPVLVDERQPVEARALHDDLKMVAAARAVLDGEFVRVGKRAAQQSLETLDGHAAMVLTAWPAEPHAVAGTSSARGFPRPYP